MWREIFFYVYTILKKCLKIQNVSNTYVSKIRTIWLIILGPSFTNLTVRMLFGKHGEAMPVLWLHYERFLVLFP